MNRQTIIIHNEDMRKSLTKNFGHELYMSLSDDLSDETKNEIIEVAMVLFADCIMDFERQYNDFGLLIEDNYSIDDIEKIRTAIAEIRG